MPKLAANLSWLFTEVAFADRFAAAAGAGFKGVECLFPYDLDAADIATRLQDNGLDMVLINVPPGNSDAGEKGLGCLPGRAGDFRAGLERALDYVEITGCKLIHVMAGIAPEGVEAARLRGVFLENLAVAAQLCGQAGVRAMIEPINTTDMPGYYLCHPDQAAALLAEIASPHLGMQFDIYHAAMLGLDIAAEIKRHFSLIGHFQIAGMPGRNEPGGGGMDVAALFGLIDDLGYKGWIGCEYRPLAGTGQGLGWITRATP